MLKDGRRGFWRSASWRARGLCSLLSAVLLMSPLPSYGENPHRQLDGIEQRLTAILDYSARLGEELQNSNQISEEQKQQIGQLLSELAELRNELEDSRASLIKSANRIAELLIIIEQLETRLKTLSENYENTVRPLREALALAEREIRRQKIKKWLWAILAGILAGIVGYGAGRVLK